MSGPYSVVKDGSGFTVVDGNGKPHRSGWVAKEYAQGYAAALNRRDSGAGATAKADDILLGGLVLLPGGEWIDPAHVIRVEGVPYAEDRQYVEVVMSDGWKRGFLREGADPAKVAARVAAEINAARQGGAR